MEPTPQPTTDEAAPFAVPPPPPPAPTAPAVLAARPVRSGDLTAGWSTLFWLAWLGIVGGFVAVWVSSWTTGLSTWWLGPQVAPRILPVRLLPFVAPIALTVMGVRRMRWLPWAGIVGAVVSALVGLGDVGRVDGYAAIELGLGLGGLLVSLGSFAGMYRNASR